jgi:sugar O-acyltransferase (sialic acid O-acetyltransferase NeuD family)
LIMTKRLVILGTGGSAYDLLDIIEAINATGPTWSIIGFLDDVRAHGSQHLGLPILGPLSEAQRFQECYFVNAIGSDGSYQHRPEIVASTRLNREQFATLLHPGAAISSRALLGRGVYVSYGVSIGGGVVIGDQVALCPGCIVGHDARVEDHTIIAPGAVISGSVRLDHNCYIGARAVIRQQLRIGERALVGMGAVVVRDVAAGSTVVGNPARLLRGRNRFSDPLNVPGWPYIPVDRSLQK